MGQFRFRGEPVSLMAIVVNLFVSMGGYICASKYLLQSFPQSLTISSHFFSVGYDIG